MSEAAETENQDEKKTILSIIMVMVKGIFDKTVLLVILGLIAGGTGITSLIQQNAIKDKQDSTEVKTQVVQDKQWKNSGKMDLMLHNDSIHLRNDSLIMKALHIK